MPQNNITFLVYILLLQTYIPGLPECSSKEKTELETLFLSTKEMVAFILLLEANASCRVFVLLLCLFLNLPNKFTIECQPTIKDHPAYCINIIGQVKKPTIVCNLEVPSEGVAQVLREAQIM